MVKLILECYFIIQDKNEEGEEKGEGEEDWDDWSQP